MDFIDVEGHRPSPVARADDIGRHVKLDTAVLDTGIVHLCTVHTGAGSHVQVVEQAVGLLHVVAQRTADALVLQQAELEAHVPRLGAFPFQFVVAYL